MKFCVLRGAVNLGTGTGGENRSGGLTANWIPRNLLTVTDEDGKIVAMPMTAPESIVAVGSVLLSLGSWSWPSPISTAGVELDSDQLGRGLKMKVQSRHT